MANSEVEGASLGDVSASEGWQVNAPHLLWVLCALMKAVLTLRSTYYIVLC